MARFIMEDLVKKAGLEERIKVDSAATSTEEIGNQFILRHGESWPSMGSDAKGMRPSR